MSPHVVLGQELSVAVGPFAGVGPPAVVLAQVVGEVRGVLEEPPAVLVGAHVEGPAVGAADPVGLRGLQAVRAPAVELPVGLALHLVLYPEVSGQLIPQVKLGAAHLARESLLRGVHQRVAPEILGPGELAGATRDSAGVASAPVVPLRYMFRQLRRRVEEQAAPGVVTVVQALSVEPDDLEALRGLAVRTGAPTLLARPGRR